MGQAGQAKVVRSASCPPPRAPASGWEDDRRPKEDEDLETQQGATRVCFRTRLLQGEGLVGFRLLQEVAPYKRDYLLPRSKGCGQIRVKGRSCRQASRYKRRPQWTRTSLAAGNQRAGTPTPGTSLVSKKGLTEAQAEWQARVRRAIRAAGGSGAPAVPGTRR